MGLTSAYGISGLVSVGPPAITGNGPPSSNFKGKLGQNYFDIGTDPQNPVEYVFNGVSWTTAGANPATTTTYGTVLLTDNNEPVATKFYADSLAIAGAPVATTTVQGIGELATDAEAIAGTPSTGLLALFVTPSNLAPVLAAGSLPGSFTDLTATGTVSFTGATGGFTITSTTASSVGTTGAGIDLTLSSASGSVPISSGEAVANAIGLQASAGGIDIDGALLVSITSSRNNANAIELVASAGGIDITAAGAAGEDIDIVNTAGSINLNSGEVIANSTVITSAGGLDISVAGTGGLDIDMVNTSGSINITAGENASDAIVITSSIGGMQLLAPAASAGEDIVITATGSSVRITSTESATDSINIESTLGGINILASGAAAGEDINLTATGSSINLSSTENAALAIALNTNGGTSETIRARNQQGTGAASIELLSTAGGITFTAGLATADAINFVTTNAAGGIDIDSGTAGFIVDTTGAVSLDSAAASNFTVTGAFDLTLNSTAGSVVITGAEAVADAVQINAVTALGGVDINAGTGGITIDSGGLMSLDAAGVVNLTTTGAFDITVNSTAGSIIVRGAEAVADAVLIDASNAAGGIDMNAGSGGMTMDTTAAISLDSATASNFTVTGAADLTLQSTAGAVNVISGEANADSINVTSAGGMNVVATGAAAKDTIITNTNGSMTLTAGENVTDAMNFTASGAASRINLTAGTGSVRLLTGLVVPVTTKATADTPYTVLGTDYFISCDTSGGVLTVTLPNAATLAGRTFVIRDTAGSAAVNNITIATAGGNLVGGGAAAATKVLSAAYSGATVYSNGVTWNYAYVA